MFIPGETEEQSDSDLVWTSQYVEFLSPKKDLKAFSDYLKARMHLKVPFEMVYNGQV
jgi:hypothetical protein